jgi:hypothetical protein
MRVFTRVRIECKTEDLIDVFVETQTAQAMHSVPPGEANLRTGPNGGSVQGQQG